MKNTVPNDISDQHKKKNRLGFLVELIWKSTPKKIIIYEDILDSIQTIKIYQWEICHINDIHLQLHYDKNVYLNVMIGFDNKALMQRDNSVDLVT